MTDGPQTCALPGCGEIVEQPDDGGPRRLYCSPAHRAAARKMRHAARMDATDPQPTSSDVTQPITQAPKDQPSEQPTTELPAPLGVTRKEDPEPAAEPDRDWSPAAAWTVSPPTLPAARTVRTITSKRVKKDKPARTAGERKNAATHMRRRAIASVAIASLVAGGASYFVTENIIPTTPTPLPPQAANQPSMDADVWVGKAEVVLASLSSQLDSVAQAEASWLALPEQRRAQEPAAVQALKDRKALLEQQRATLMSQLEAFKALPDRTSELTSAQAQLDAVERTLNESTTTAASPDYQEALRQLESQRDIRRQQRDHAAQALTDLRNGVEQALGSPLPAEKDETAPIVERVKAVVEGRPDPGDKDDDQEHKAADDQDPAATSRREDGDEERGDVGTTAPPDPERPNTPDILAGGNDNSGSDADGGSEGSNGDEESSGPAQSVASALGSALGQGDTSNQDESANRRDARTEAGTDGDGDSSNEGSNNDRGGLGGAVRGVAGGLLGGSERDDDNDDERASRNDDRADNRSDDRDDDERGKDDDRSNGWFDRGNNDDDDRDDGSSWFSDRDDRDDDGGDDDRGNRRERDGDDDDDDRGGLSDIADGLLGGDRGDDDGDKGDDEHADDDSDRKKPSGKAERQREKERESSDRHHENGDDEHADDGNERKKPSGKAERQREKDREDSEERSDNDDEGDRGDNDHGDRGDNDGDDDRGNSDDSDDDRGNSDHGDNDEADDGGDDDGGKSDGGSDDGGDDDGGSDDGGSGGGDDD